MARPTMRTGRAGKPQAACAPRPARWRPVRRRRGPLRESHEPWAHPAPEPAPRHPAPAGIHPGDAVSCATPLDDGPMAPPTYHGDMADQRGRVLLADPRGYCAGVDRAVVAVERALEIHGAPVYVRKQIVHNKHVVATLERRGAVFVDETD